MASFLVEAYAPATADLAAIEARAQCGRATSRRGAPPIQYVRSIFVPSDETCFHIFEAPSREAVIGAIERVGLAYERVSEARRASPTGGAPRRTLAEFMFDDERAMVRLDMSEYQERHTVARLIGAPPGYIGYEEGGQLTEAVRRRPYSVVLLDEIEKAHMEVFDVLLQILDDGRLTDGHGRTVDFRNSVVIMTSNLRTIDDVRASLRPEFIHRIDEIVVFEQLTREQLADIVELQLRRLRERLVERRLELKITDEAKELIAEAGWDPAFGARPLKRALQRLVENPLALALLEGDFQEGDTIRVDASGDELAFEKAVGVEAEAAIA